MNYISIRLYSKVVDHALSEGLDRKYLQSLPTPIDEIYKLNAVPAEHFFELHNFCILITFIS